MKYQTSVFPLQKLPMNQKNKEWQEKCVDYVIGMGETVPAGSDRTTFEDMQVHYDLYNSIFNEKDLKYVTDPFKQDDGFPASPQNFNIIKPKIDLLIGEETKLPFNFRVIRTSQDATSEAQEQMKKMLFEYLMQDITASMDDNEAALFEERLSTGEIAPPENITEFISKDYKDIAESTAYHSLNYLKEKLNLQHEFSKGFKDALIAGKEVYYNGILNGEPHLEHVNPMYFAHDNSPDLEFIEDGDWAIRRMRMSYTEIYDRLYDKMTDKELDQLLEMVGEDPGSGKYGKQMPSGMDYMHTSFKSVTGPGNDAINDNNILNLWHVVWKSFKKIGFVTAPDENGEPQKITVTEDYLSIGNEISIEWKWCIEIWEGYRIGEDLFVGVQPLEYQHISADSVNSQKLPYSGVIYNNANSPSKSLVSILKPLQYMYIIIWYRLELALARDKGKVLTMDITQIPKSMNIDAAKWMHYLSAVGVNFVNPYEEGWDIPGREGGKSSQFNQIAAVDLTMANVIGQYIDILSKIEEMAGELSGVNRQRQGAISNRELVGAVERSVVQSSLITEPIFWLHNQCKKNTLRMLLNTAKEAWVMSEKTHLQYVLNDSTRAFLTLTPKFFYEDFDIFVTDSSKELQMLEAIKSLYQPAMQNGAGLLDIAEIMTMDNITEIKQKLGEIEKMHSEQQQAAADADNQRQGQLIQMQNEVKQQEMQIRQAEMELDKYKIDMDNQTRIAVAEMQAYRGAQDMDQNANGIPDPMEIADLALRQNELDSNVFDRQMQQLQKQREADNKVKLENKKIDAQKEIEKRRLALDDDKIKLERDKMKMQERLQKLKDSAALEREKLKSRTALKNKTVSGK